MKAACKMNEGGSWVSVQTRPSHIQQALGSWMPGSTTLHLVVGGKQNEESLDRPNKSTEGRCWLDYPGVLTRDSRRGRMRRCSDAGLMGAELCWLAYDAAYKRWLG